MENVIIQVDSREQNNKHVLEQFDKLGVKYFVSKLYAGDYTLLHNQSIVIERKKDVLEIASCICGDNHIRFRNEVIRSRDNGIKLYILIEDEYIYNIDGVKYYQIPHYKGNQYKDGKLIHKRGEKRSQVNLEALAKAMRTMEEKYDCTFCFAKHNDFGKKVLELLGVNV